MKFKIILIIFVSIFLFIALNILIPLLVYNEFILEHLNTPLLLLLDGLLPLLVTLIIVSFFILLQKETIAGLGFNRSNWKKNLFLGSLIGLLSISVGVLAIVLTKTIYFESIVPIRWHYILAGFVMVFLSASSEEIFFRGFIQNRLAKITNPYISVIITSVVFCLLHAFNANVSVLMLINVFVASIFLGVSFLYSENILLPIGFHVFWNFTQGGIWGFSISGDDGIPSFFSLNFLTENQINGGSIGFENSIICSIVLICLCLTLFFLQKNKIKRAIL